MQIQLEKLRETNLKFLLLFEIIYNLLQIVFKKIDYKSDKNRKINKYFDINSK